MLAVVMVINDIILYIWVVLEEKRKEGKVRPDQYFKRKYWGKLSNPTTKH